MITLTMTAEEISNSVDKDRERIKRFINYRFKDIDREMRKGFRKNAYKVIDYNVNSNMYKLLLYIEDKRRTFTILAVNNFTNELLDVTYSINTTDPAVPYTARSIHFFRRYAERYLQQPDMDINKVILEFYKDCNCSVILYMKDNKIVYAGMEGITLATFEKEKLIIHVVTFISLPMLKLSQFSAWLKAQEASIKLDAMVKEELETTGKLTPMNAFTWQLNKHEMLTLKEAGEIYDMYFKDK